MSGAKRVLTMASLGGAAGLVAALVASLFMPSITLQGTMKGPTLQDVDIRDFIFSDKPFGIVGHSLLGALVCAVVGLAFVWRRGPNARLRAVAIASPLGAMFCWGGSFLADRLLVSMTLQKHGTTVLPLHEASSINDLPGLLQYTLMSASLTIPIFLGAGPTLFNLARSVIGAGLAFVFGQVLRNVFFMLMLPILVMTAISSVNAKQIDLMSFVRPIYMAELMGMGAGAGLAFAVAEIVWKPAWLKGRRGATEGKSWSLARPLVRIGSMEGVEVFVPPDGTVAPVHAQIQATDDAHFLVDACGSTTVNGHPIQSFWLHDCDTIGVGSAELVYRTRLGSPAVNARAPERQTAAHVSDVSVRFIDGLGNAHTLGPGVHVVGRDPGCQIALPWEPSVSRSHAEITVGPAGVSVRDLGSTNGTYVGESRVQDAVHLMPGDTVRFGQFKMKLGP